MRKKKKTLAERLLELLPEEATHAEWLTDPGDFSDDFLNGLVKGWNDCLDCIKNKIRPN